MLGALPGIFGAFITGVFLFDLLAKSRRLGDGRDLQIIAKIRPINRLRILAGETFIALGFADYFTGFSQRVTRRRSWTATRAAWQCNKKLASSSPGPL